MMKEKTDPFTGETFYPKRSNQNFASPENRIAFHNAIAKEKRHYLNEIDSQIRKNWEIILEILGEEQKVTESEEFLLGCGFNFHFFNHVRTEENIAYLAIYNVGIRKVESNIYELINFE